MQEREMAFGYNSAAASKKYLLSAAFIDKQHTLVALSVDPTVTGDGRRARLHLHCCLYATPCAVPSKFPANLRRRVGTLLTYLLTQTRLL